MRRRDRVGPREAVHRPEGRSRCIDSVAAVSVGIIDGEPMLDLAYIEDVRAETDMNVVATGRGLFVEVQGTAEGAPFDRRELDAPARPRASPAPRRSPRCSARRSGSTRDRARRGASCSPRTTRTRSPSCGAILGPLLPGVEFVALRRPGAGRGRRHLRRERADQGARGARRTPGCRRSPTTPASRSTPLGGAPGHPLGPLRRHRRDDDNRDAAARAGSATRPTARAHFVCAAVLVAGDERATSAEARVARARCCASRARRRRLRLRPGVPPRRTPTGRRRRADRGREERGQPPRASAFRGARGGSSPTR